MNFNESVWRLLKRVPEGKVTTYKRVAVALGNENSARAVGNACRANPFAPRIPCHRVVSSDSRIGGYARGIKKKTSLLRREGIIVKGGKIVGFRDKLFEF